MPPFHTLATACTLYAFQLFASAAIAAPYSNDLELQGIKFRIETSGPENAPVVTITPSGLKIVNDAVTREINGAVTGSEVADINSDGSPEVYVYVTGNDPYKKGSIIAFSANNLKSLSDITIPEIGDDPKNAVGYVGYDQSAAIETSFSRRFPIYELKDGTIAKTEKYRQLQYKLKQGEAGWKMVLDKVIEY